MNVTFTCEECGATAYVGERVETTCAKLMYGPLTEEMVEEALRVARDSAPGCGLRELAAGPTAQARFVLRLLIDGGLANDKPTVDRGCTAEDWHDWLLDLARQK